MSEQSVRDQIIEALKTVRDPEIPINIYDLGLIYDLDIGENGAVHIRMTLTTPNCPVAEAIPSQVQQAAMSVPGVTDVKVELVWEPTWTPDRMSESAKLELGTMGLDFLSGPSQQLISSDDVFGKRKR